MNDAWDAWSTKPLAKNSWSSSFTTLTTAVDSKVWEGELIKFTDVTCEFWAVCVTDEFEVEPESKLLIFVPWGLWY